MAAHRSRTGRILPTRRLCVHVPREFCVRSVRRYPGGMLWWKPRARQYCFGL